MRGLVDIVVSGTLSGHLCPIGLDLVETANWFPKICRKDYTIAINGTESGVDDPDQQFYENFVCGAVRNYTGYCNPEVDKLIDRQSAEPQPGEAQADCLADRKKVGRGRRAADHLLSARRHLFSALCQGARDDGQQHLQRLSRGGRLARQVALAHRR